MREHVLSVGRLLGNYECEKISPRYIFYYLESVSVQFLGQVPANFVLEFQQLSFQAFEGYFQWISKAGISNFYSCDQWISMESNRCLWTLLDPY